MKRLIDHFLAKTVIPYLEPRMRMGSIKAAKAYVQAVRVARTLVMQGFVIGSLTAILITGALMLIFGVLALLPLQPWVIPTVAIVLGTLFAGVTGIGFYIFFKEENWLEKLKAYDVMDAVMSPWENQLVPPNPFAPKATAGHADTASLHRNEQVLRDLAASEASKKEEADKLSAPLIRSASSHTIVTPPSSNQPAFS